MLCLWYRAFTCCVGSAGPLHVVLVVQDHTCCVGSAGPLHVVLVVQDHYTLCW